MRFDQEEHDDSSVPKDASSGELLKAIRELNKSVTKLTQIFEEANQEMIDEYQGSRTQIKEKLNELTDQNQLIAQSIVGLADMVKTPIMVPIAKPIGTTMPPKQTQPAPQILDKQQNFHFDEEHPELDFIPEPNMIPGKPDNVKNEAFDIDHDNFDQVSFNNKHGVGDSWMAQQMESKPGVVELPDLPSNPQESPLPGFDFQDPFAGDDPFAPPKMPQGQPNYNQFNPQGGSMNPAPTKPLPPGSMQPGLIPPKDDFFGQNDFGQQSANFPPIPSPLQEFGSNTPEPPKKQGLFSKILKR